MASTNKTTHYELSQYIGTDKPTYLVDYNTDMNNIDTGIYNAQSKANTNETAIGNLSNLDTSVKTDLVSAINEEKGKTDKIGNLSNLTTSANTDLVVAINEVDAEADANNQNIGTMTNLETTVKTSLVGAINEVNTKATTNANNIGTLSNLGTTEKSNLVGAINEVLGDIHDIEYGTIPSSDMTTYTVGGEDKKKYDVVFTKTYTTAPIVLVTTYNNAISTYGIILSAVDNVTTTGCTLLFDEDVSSTTTGINYIVINKN